LKTKSLIYIHQNMFGFHQSPVGPDV